MYSVPEMMNPDEDTLVCHNLPDQEIMFIPDPPTICGTQYIPSSRPCDILLLIFGSAVKPDI